jgi:two-component system OmpR family sensor kinase
VHVSVRRRGSAAVPTVADEGPGLAPEQAARLFDRFYQGSEARTGEGTGLGLSIVAALATAHGGRAFVRSEPGEGTAFTVELPVGRADPESADPESADVGRTQPSPPPAPRPSSAVSSDATVRSAHEVVEHGPRPVRH